MTLEETKDVVGRFLAAFKVGDMEAVAAFYAPDYVNHTPYPGAPSTFKGHAAFMMAAAPFLEFISNETVEVVIGAGNASILSKSRYRVRETGKEFDAFGLATFKLKDGLIIENWGGYDPVGAFNMFKSGIKMELNPS